MVRRTVSWLLTISLINLFSILGCSDAENRDWTERADPGTGISLRLAPETQVIKVGQSPRFTATLVNGGNNEVILVEPGDGSDCGWRTPVVEWSRRRKDVMRCGNVNPLKSDEVFTLQPGKSHELNGWVGEPYLSGPGRYRVALRYRNEPEHHQSGVTLDKDDPKALEGIRRSTPVSVVSNTVEIVIEQ
jgi:hypothetical protein